jgi:hypothetical protein
VKIALCGAQDDLCEQKSSRAARKMTRAKVQITLAAVKTIPTPEKRFVRV